ncbi:alpha/beta hydrolase [Asanoa ishikariensis]|uniref:Pimeloyl-ACP methyl ester carboxylesterase n=1 Tax=Asanoa ishikariensis TaxID=137265 RepID=A0A1H3M7R9_9ACTN|nr:alpha/beta fold hydrolase [Asanoa ishikariensis]GIF65943.1 alpha/beta hydrolase [Asanoa ishikariensis]SDY72249.1 Pimeloyl-ACP methyl ester carboxylesterase [Asanoa ishikariensis]
MKVTVAEGVGLNVLHTAGPSAPAFVLVHGLASNARLWSEVASALAAAGHPSYAVDLRGHGESDLPSSGFSTAAAAADLAAVIASLGLSRPIVAGQSWGGNVVVRLAAAFPGVVGALALVDGGWIDLPATFGSWSACAAALRPPELDGLRASDFRARLRSGHPDWSASAVEATLANLRVDADGLVSRRLPVARHMEILRSMYDEPPAQWYPALTMPVLLMPAGRGLPSPSVAASIPDAVVRPYAGGDHDLHAQHPAEVAADLLSLVRS